MAKQAPPRAPSLLIFVATPGERRAVWAACRRAAARLTLTGIGPTNAARAARAALAALPPNCRPLVAVVGIGGALAPLLAVGDVVLGTSSVSPDGVRHRCCSTATACVAARLAAAGWTVHQGDHLTVPAVVCRVAEKQRLYAQTGAWVVDMESQAIAQAVGDAGLPLLLVRVISDDTRHDLPNFDAAFDSDYRVRPPGLAAALVAHPVASIRFLRNLRRALVTLRRILGIVLAEEPDLHP